MKQVLVCALILSVLTAPMVAADNVFVPTPFNTDAAVAAAGQSARKFTPDAPHKANISKAKVGVIAAIAGAGIVVGLVLTKGSGKGSGSPTPPPSGPIGSVLVINGVPQ